MNGGQRFQIPLELWTWCNDEINYFHSLPWLHIASTGLTRMSVSCISVASWEFFSQRDTVLGKFLLPIAPVSADDPKEVVLLEKLST